MARVQPVISGEDRERFRSQARQERMASSAWLYAAAHDRLLQRQRRKRFESPEEIEGFSESARPGSSLVRRSGTVRRYVLLLR